MSANLSVKNVPEEIVRALQSRAIRNQRSLQEELLDILRQAARGHDPVTIDDLLDHVDYLVGRAGIDHVGIGLDLLEFWDTFTATGVMSTQSWPPERAARIVKPSFGTLASPERVRGLASVAEIPNLTQGLLDRGYSRDAVEKIMGGNVLRVFHQIWGE